jgi:hypothetical protein
VVEKVDGDPCRGPKGGGQDTGWNGLGGTCSGRELRSGTLHAVSDEAVEDGDDQARAQR